MNYKNILKKMNSNYISDEKYFLINKQLISEIKKVFHFEEFKKEFDFSFNTNEKNLEKVKLSFLKKLSISQLQEFFENKNLEGKFNKSKIIMAPDMIPINKTDFNNSENNIFIFDNFEMLEKSVVDLFIYDIGYENNYLECSLGQGKIIINYPWDRNSNYISVIGTLNNENNFIKEYILIYYSYSDKLTHMNELKYKLNNYLQSLQLYDNSAPITEKETYKEIGKIIKLENNNVENFKKNYTPNDNINNINPKLNTLNNIDMNSDFQNYDFSENFNENIQNSFGNKNDYFVQEREYNLDVRITTPYIRDHFAIMPLIGLENIGATCYMNATLQCFCHIEKFINFFKYSKNLNDLVRKDKSKLCSSFKLLIEKLWPDNYNDQYLQNYYAPEEFKRKISKMNPLFKGVAANDSKDLVNFIIMTLHEELNKAKKTNTNTNIFIDQRNQQLIFNTFAQNFMQNNVSIISDLFYGINCSITQCGGCGANTFNYQTYFFIVFPLEEVRKFKFGDNYLYNNNIVDIYDCFNYDRKINYMVADNSMYCNYCKKNCNSSMKTVLTTGPELLILLLNRGKGIQFEVKINFYPVLNLNDYIQYNNTGATYKLMGVITHLGESGMSGHFIAYCLDPLYGSWYKYNDAIVSKVNDFQKEVINYAMPYLLFYQKNQ